MKKHFTVIASLFCASVCAQYCMLPGQTPYSSLQPGITNFKMHTINRTSGNSESTSAVVVVTGLSATVIPGQTYTISISHSEDTQFFPGARNNLRVWIDYNKNFSFTDAGETVLSKDLEAPATTYTATVTIPAATPAGTLTLRATAKMSNDAGHTLPTPCNVPADPLGYHGEMEDYSLIIESSTQGQAPVAAFTVNTPTLCTPQKLLLTNNTSGTPTPTYSWSASPQANVTFSPSSTANQPTVSFSAAGKYTITCMATNSLGSNSAIQQVTVAACNITGVDENAVQQGIQLYPNPAADDLTVAYAGTNRQELIITDVTGAIVMRTELPAGTGLKTIDVSALPSGIFFVSGTEAGGVFHKRLVINK